MYISAQHKWWTQKEQVCLLAAVLTFFFRLMHNDFEWLYCTLLLRHRNVMEFVCLYAAVAFSTFLDEGKEQRLVAASCVIPRNAICVSNLRITTGARPIIHVHHVRMRTLVRAAILRLRCLQACIFRLKSAYAMLIRLCLLRLWA